MGEEESDVDIEGFEEDDDGKPKTPAPVINVHKTCGLQQENLSPFFTPYCLIELTNYCE